MMARVGDELIHRFRRARRERDRVVVIEGFHALKHALRFGAELIEAVAVDPPALEALAAELAPDLAGELAGAGRDDRRRDAGADRAAGAPHRRRRDRPPARRSTSPRRSPTRGPAPVVLLEDPRNMGNIGACVRVAAAAGAAAMLTTGENDPWFPDAVRGAAGLHFALPGRRPSRRCRQSDRPLLAIDPEGEELAPERLPPRAILAFGTERHGLTGGLLERADARVAIPMQPGVSSLNLATSVAITLYAWRLAKP